MERGPFSLVSTIEELLESNSSGFGPQKLALTSPTSGGRSFDIVRSWAKAMEFSVSIVNMLLTVMLCLLSCMLLHGLSSNEKPWLFWGKDLEYSVMRKSGELV
jgi:hypothetical protein